MLKTKDILEETEIKEAKKNNILIHSLPDTYRSYFCFSTKVIYLHTYVCASVSYDRSLSLILEARH